MSDGTAMKREPTVVLVHGAFVDASSWAGVIAELQDDGIAVLAPAHPLRGLASDAAYIASYVAQIDGPVLLVGHSYAGAVIGVAAAGAANVVGLVYIAAYIPEVGETITELNGRFPDTPLGAAVRTSTFPLAAGGTAVEASVAIEAFGSVIAAGVPARDAAISAASQRPLAVSAFDDQATAAAWKTLPSWAIIPTRDQAINPDLERFMAARAGAVTRELDGPHALMVAAPGAVAEQIRAAQQAVSAVGAAAS